MNENIKKSIDIAKKLEDKDHYNLYIPIVLINFIKEKSDEKKNSKKLLDIFLRDDEFQQYLATTEISC